jgi:hypothetical protein
MLETRFFGTTCQGCKGFVPLGEIEIEANAPPSKLRDRLREIGWKDDWAICENPECGSRTFCTLDQAILRADI